MLNRILDFKEIKSSGSEIKLTQKTEKASNRDIAVIGISGRFPLADNVSLFWENLRQGMDCIREYPETRFKDIEPLLPNGFMPKCPPELCEAGYLNDIDKFDYEFFNISPSEARLMDPNQRLFLQTAWSVIEDAGYGGSRIRGSKTGMYLGYSTDLKFEYHMYVNMADPKSYEHISLPGNVKSIIASRISYILDLKGPSMVIDTACSSSLVAVHLACRGIIEGDCDMAVAGGVKVNIMPIQKGMDDEIGIRSPGDRARTFDDSSDGTGSGEGVAAIMLKSLNKAIADGDNIYAVIKGSAINQDGNSIGLTAPNSAAQEEVILEAWKNAGINPETVSYIEAHGTATKLGDPIEISGIERAFRKHTNKRNFCAVGSVKTNIGHLDNLAGIAGLIKLILAVKHREIPASIHFERPNRKIDFINSPVYVNDKHTAWETDGFPLRAGVSSFGLAGTNCHVVVEEYKENIDSKCEENSAEAQILTISARNREALTQLIEGYIVYLEGGANTLEDICDTANSGRLHHSHRLAVIGKTVHEIRHKLENFDFKTDHDENIYYSAFRIVNQGREKSSYNEVSDTDTREYGRLANELIRELYKKDNNRSAILEKICGLYINGAEIEWSLLNKGSGKTSLPSYPFKRSRCWVEASGVRNFQKPVSYKEIDHPLVDRCVIKTPGQEIYQTTINADTHWVIGQHRVAGRCVMPGTAYLEMIRQIYSKHLVHSYLELDDILFISPFIAEDGEDKELQIIVSEKDNHCDFIIASQSQAGHGWNIHVEGRARTVRKDKTPLYDISRIMHIANMNDIDDESGSKSIVDIGPRWTGISRKIYSGWNGEYLAFFEMPDEYMGDLEKYYLHPPLMDRSINAVNTFIGDGSYLPLSYRNITIYGPTPKEFYSYLKRKDIEKESLETARFDILLIDKEGRVFIEIKDYVIKRVRDDEFRFRQLKENRSFFHEAGWRMDKPEAEEKDLSTGDVLVFKGPDKITEELVSLLKAEGCGVIEVETGSEFSEFSENRYVICGEESCYNKLLEKVRTRKLSRIIHLASLKYANEIESAEELEESQKHGAYSLFYLTRALLSNKFNKEIDIVLVSSCVSEVTREEKMVNPHNASMFGLGKVVSMEYPHLKCRCIDIDDRTSAEEIMSEIRFGGNSYQTAFRNGIRYIDEFRKLNIAKYHSIKTDIREQGVYIISGGTGGIGLEIGKYIASKNKAKIALISRGGMPERELWNELLESDTNSKICRAIKAIREMEKNGAEISCICADVSNYSEMERVIEGLKNRYGSINGVIHCAGVAGDGFIIRKEKADFDSVISPKIHGTWILDRLTSKEDMDFFVMFSSITSVLGGEGQGDYTAANAYMDSFAGYRSRQGKRTVSINWSAWKDTGMAVDYGVDESKSTLQAISTENAILAFQEILSRQKHNVIIGEVNYEVFAANKDRFPISMADDTQLMLNEYDSTIKTDTESYGEKKSREIKVKGGEDEVFSPTELKIAGIWAEILGLDEVDVYDNFNDLGGDSILATRLLRRLEDEYPGMIDIADVFAYSTVNKMAEYIDEATGKHSMDEAAAAAEDGPDELDELLDKLAKGEISVSEAEKYY